MTAHATIGHYDDVARSALPLGSLVKLAIGLELVLSIGAFGGGVALMAGPDGEIIPLPLSALAGSPFTSYFVPGAILFAILGVGPLVASVLALRRNAFAPLAALVVGGALIIWIGVEIGIIGYSNDPPLQAVYLALGVVITIVGGAWVRQTNVPQQPFGHSGRSSTTGGGSRRASRRTRHHKSA
jgi:hypothetical protein